jgi:hypothetical protein
MILALAKLTPAQVSALWGDVRTSRRPTWEAAMAARGHRRPARSTAPSGNGSAGHAPEADQPTVWDNVAQGLWPRLRELGSNQAELRRLSELNMDDQRAVVALIDGTTYRTVAAAISGWSRPASEPADDPGAAQAPTNGRARVKNGTAEIVDGLMRTHVGPIARGLNSIANLLGEGPNYRAAYEAHNTLIAALKELRKGHK